GNQEAKGGGGGGGRKAQGGRGGGPKAQAGGVAEKGSRGQLPRLRSDQRHPAGPDPPEAKITSGPLKARRGLRPAAPFSHSRRNCSFFLKISGNWPIIRLESSAFTGFGERWLENISALTASAAVPTGRLRRNCSSRSARRRA